MGDEELESLELQYLRETALNTQVTSSLYPVKPDIILQFGLEIYLKPTIFNASVMCK